MNRNILHAAIKAYGKEAQTLMLFEEMSELQKELCKNARGKENYDEITEEIADVEIMLEQAKIMYDIKESQIGIVKEEKLRRLAKRIGYLERDKKVSKVF